MWDRGMKERVTDALAWIQGWWRCSSGIKAEALEAQSRSATMAVGLWARRAAAKLSNATQAEQSTVLAESS